MKYELIAEVDKKLKWSKLYLSGGHLASCYPDRKRNTMTGNVYRHLSGKIKDFMGGGTVFVKLPIDSIPLTSDNVRALEQEAIDIVRAKQKL